LCRFAAVKVDSKHPRKDEVFKEALESLMVYEAIDPSTGPENEDLAIESMLIAEIALAMHGLPQKVQLTWPEVSDAIGDMTKAMNGKIPDRLSNIMRRVLSTVTDIEVKVFNRFCSEVENSLGVRLPRFEYKRLASANVAFSKREAFAAFEGSESLFNVVREAQECTFPYHILQHSFDRAVLTCGLNPAIIPVLETALTKAGVRLVVDLNGMVPEKARPPDAPH